MARREDDFPASVVRNVALRAGYLCSNPDCRRPTSGPHSDPKKAIITGEAAHICAAKPNGPRYDGNQTSEERKDITNAIWLCGSCAKKVDSDWRAWPASRLHDMKDTHEKWISQEAMIPSFPEISLKTHPTLRVSRSLPEITAELQATLRDQELTVKNPNRVELLHLSLEWTLPESVAGEGESSVPPGSTPKISRVEPDKQTFVSGRAKFTPKTIPTNRYKLQIDRLPPGQEFSFGFYTIVPEQTMPYQLGLMGYELDPELMDEHKECHFHLEGTYQFVLRGEHVTSDIFIPLLFKAKDRLISSYPPQNTTRPWKVARTMLMSGGTFQF